MEISELVFMEEEYQKPFDNDVREHRDRFRKQEDSKNPLVLVHPFHPFVVAWDIIEQLGEEYRDLTLQYLENVAKAIKSSKTKVILADTQIQYALFSSKLLEDGIVDDVVFTEPNRGFLVEDREPRIQNLDTFYLGGCVLDVCVKQFIASVFFRDPLINIYVVPELVIESPSRTRIPQAPINTGYIFPTYLEKANGSTPLDNLLT